LVSAFQARDGDERDAEMVGDVGEGEVFGLPGGPQIAVVVDGAGPGELSLDFAGDGAFEQPQNLFFGAVFGPLVLDVVASLWVAGHADQRDAVKRTVGCAVATAGKSVAGDFPGGCRDGAAPHKAAKEASLRSRCGLVPAVTSNWAAVSGPTP
jgi:hypothetical protein